MENNVWRIRYNEALNTLLKGEDIVRFVRYEVFTTIFFIVRFIKSQRIRWLGHAKEWKTM
jgi:hypothetical protein